MEQPNQTPNNAHDSEPEHSSNSAPLNGKPSSPIQRLPRLSTWSVVAFSILSLGLYSTYWLFTRTQIINQLHDNKIPMSIAHTVIGLLLVNLIFSIMSIVYPDNLEYSELASLSGLGFNLGSVFWVFMLRHRIHAITLAGEKSLFWLNGIFTFLFQVMYLQYKINEYIDDHTSESSLTA